MQGLSVGGTEAKMLPMYHLFSSTKYVPGLYKYIISIK